MSTDTILLIYGLGLGALCYLYWKLDSDIGKVVDILIDAHERGKI